MQRPTEFGSRLKLAKIAAKQLSLKGAVDGLGGCLDSALDVMLQTNRGRSFDPRRPIVYEADLGGVSAWVKLFDPATDTDADSVAGEIRITQVLSALVAAGSTPFFPLLYASGVCERPHPALRLPRYNYLVLEALGDISLRTFARDRRNQPRALRWNVVLQVLLALLTMQSVRVHHNDFHARNLHLVRTRSNRPWQYQIMTRKDGVLDMFVPNLGVQVVIIDFGKATWKTPLSTVPKDYGDWETLQQDYFGLLKCYPNDPDAMSVSATLAEVGEEMQLRPNCASEALAVMYHGLRDKGIWDLRHKPASTTSNDRPYMLGPYGW